MGRRPDIREEIFRECGERRTTGIVTAEASGVLSGIQHALDSMKSLVLDSSTGLVDGSEITQGHEVARLRGNPVQTAQAEARIIGQLSKPSGIATADRKAGLKAGGRIRVVSGGWKNGISAS